MRETTLLKIALVSGIAGLILLFFTLETTPVPPASIAQLRTEDIRHEVLIHGTVTRITKTNATQFLDLVSDEPFSVAVLRDDAIPITLGAHVEVRGKIEEFNGKSQFQGQEVRVV